MLLKLGAALLAVPVAAVAVVGGTVAKSGLLMVDVKDKDHHIMLPVPLGLARAALALAPHQNARINVDIPPAQAEMAREMVAALAEAPDGELVRVEQTEQKVVIAKEGNLLRVHVTGPGEEVNVAVPFSAALRLMPKDGHTVDPSALADVLDELRFTDLVDVRHGDERVKVWVF